ncbi:diguanylate cyclase [Paenibacillus spiritus]|uniref:Diguanylate cyclase n=1 Tax=Paenibacillus spiritus TaxID=2496557 RepID=A0A5J5G8I8_9BACL|nr:diguanylate cyclase [Paenibacillus spiritus]KAA9004130.1 diguanylate cyclase [Paenibacillus spiritus]
MFFRLRSVFAGAFAVIIILLTLLLSWVIGSEATRSSETSVGQSLSEVAYQMSESLDQFMWARAGEIETISRLQAFQQPVDPNEVTALLNQLKQSLSVFTWVGYLDTKGKVTASTDNILLGQNISQRPVFQEGMNGLYVGDVHDAVLLSKYLPNPDGEPLQFVDVSVPVYGPDNAKIGVLAAHLSWEWSRQVEESIIYPLRQHTKNVEVFVVSRSGHTILLGPKERVGQKMDPETMLQALNLGNSWFVEKDNGSRTGYLTGYARSNGYLDYPGLGWTVVIRQPADIAFASIQELKRTIALSGISVSVLFAIAGWFLAGWIVGPLRRIAAAADELSSGTAVEIPNQSRIREVRHLSDSLRNLIAALTHTETELFHMSDAARHDPLTGLPNRMALDDFLAHAVSRAKQNHSTLTFLYLDLDGFKRVNDARGHAVGDKLLQEVAFRLVESTRDNEIVTRIGGDEFVVVLHTSLQKPMQEAETVAKRIIDAINRPFLIENQPIQIGCSVGAAIWSPDSQDTSETLRLADEALYISKRSGKNRITFESAS